MGRIMGRMSIFALAFLMPIVSSAKAQQVTSIDIVEYGLYTADRVKAQRAASGVLQATIGNIRHAATTTTVPAQIGVRFGFRYRVNGLPAGQKVQLRKVTVYPAGGARPPNSTQPLQKNETALAPTIGETTYTGYTFDEAWERLPGTWTIQLWYGDRKFAEKSFTVVQQ
jgi:hypothetical protein